LSKQIKESVKIPEEFRSPEAPFRISASQLKQDFIKDNPGYKSSFFEVSCSGSGRFLKELYVCLSRDGKPVACGTDVRKDALKSCQKADKVILAWGKCQTQKSVDDRISEVVKLLEPLKEKLYEIADESGKRGLHPLSASVRLKWNLVPYRYPSL
jgi:hypothetical protein